MDHQQPLFSLILPLVFSIIGGIVVVLGWSLTMGRKLQVLDDLKTDMGKVKHNLKVIILALIKSSIQLNPNEIKSLSPSQLTEQGQQLIKDLGFDKIFEEHKAEFYKSIDEDNPKLKYDVEISAIKALYSLYDQPFMAPLKVYFYNYPDRNLENTAPTLGLYMRDKYLADHPGITE